MLLLSDIKCNDVLRVAQWGKVGSINAWTEVPFEFPLAFTTTPYCVQLQRYTQNVTEYSVSVWTLSTTKVTIWGYSSNNVFIFALGK